MQSVASFLHTLITCTDKDLARLVSPDAGIDDSHLGSITGNHRLNEFARQFKD